jgi:hypothetical protein
VTGVPEQTDPGLTLAVPGTGGVVVVIVIELVALQHPNGPPVTVQVYVVVTVGEAIGFAIVGLLKLPAGVHE